MIIAGSVFLCAMVGITFYLVIDFILRTGHNMLQSLLPAPRYKKSSILIPDSWAVRNNVRYFYTDEEYDKYF